MSVSRPRPRPLSVYHGPRIKTLDLEPPQNSGNLSPDLQPSSPPEFPRSAPNSSLKLGRYVLLEQSEGSDVYKAFETQTQEESICKVVSLDRYRDVLGTYWQVDCHSHISSIKEIIIGETKAYIFFRKHYGDLHSYVRQRKRLKEVEACHLFKQVVGAVAHCHQNGVVLRDLKLRKFVFSDPERTQLKLEGLEDAFVLEDEDDDNLTDKHGCPAYVSPEILNATGSYSGKAADIWSLGVMLYTMLIGRYPFHDSEPSALFGKIRRGQYSVPETITSGAKCLIKNLLRRDPADRLLAADILIHPWLRGQWPVTFLNRVDKRPQDQTVPDIAMNEPVDSSTS